MKSFAVQDYYPDELSYCFGCGKHNEQGHQLKTFWEGDETVSKFTPKDFHIAIPGFVYGGLIASIIDCHGTGSAALAMYKIQNREIDSEPALRFVTASLQVDFLKPTPLGKELELRGKVFEITERKVITEINLYANGKVTAKGKVVAILLKEKNNQII